MRRLILLALLCPAVMIGQQRPVGVYALDGSDSGASGGVGTVTSANYVLAGPTGAGGPSTFRLLTAADFGLTLAPTFASLTIASQTTPGINFSGTLTGAGIASHAIEDNHVLNTSGSSAYASFDAQTTITGADTYNHSNAFQARQIYQGTGSIATMYGFLSNPVITGPGPLSAYTGMYLNNPGGAGTITTNVGLDIGNLTRGTTNIPIRSAGLTASEFAGPLYVTRDSTEGGANYNSGSFAIRSADTTRQLNIGYQTTGNYAWMQSYDWMAAAAKPLYLNPLGGTVTVGAGSATAAPLKLTSGPLLTTTQAGAVEFLSDAYYATITTGAGETSFYPPAQSGTYVKATTSYDATADPWLATDPAKSLIGPRSGNSWMSLSGGGNVNQRLHIDLGTAVVVTKIMYHNFHASGIDTSVGVKNFTFWGSNDSGAFSTTTYATDTNWTQIPLGTTQFLEHAASDTPDPQYIDVPTGLPYRYYAFKFADNYGYVSVMGVRRIELQTGGPRKGIILNDGLALTAGRIPYVTTGGRLMDSSAITTDGSTVTATGFTGASYRGVNVTGTNQAAADLPISSGLGTGTGTPSSVVFSTPTIGTTGSAAQTAATRLTVNSTAVTTAVPLIVANSPPGTAAFSLSGYPLAGLRAANNAQLEIISNNSRVAYTTAAGLVVNALSISGDVDLTRAAAATLQLGAANSATPVAQTLTFQGSRGGTDTNVAGQTATITGSLGTGTAVAGPISVRTGYPTTTGTTQHVASTRIYAPGTWTNLTESTDTAIATLTFGASIMVGGQWLVTIKATDGTEVQAITYRVTVNSVRKSTGNTVSTIGAVAEASAAVSSGTLTATFTVTEGASAAVLNCNAVSSLTQTVLAASWQSLTNGSALTLAQN